MDPPPEAIANLSEPASAADAADDIPVTVIERRPGWRFLDLAELWRYRELLFFLTWRDVKVRYKQTALGAAWAILQPLATMIVFSLFFGRAIVTPSADVPYPLFVLSGLVPWMFFATALTSASQSVVSNQSLITKIYFPRLLIPIGVVGASLVDLAISLTLLMGMTLIYGVRPGLGILVVPILLLTLTAAVLGVGILLAGVTVAYRDFRHIVPFMVQIWMLATPSIYMPVDAWEGSLRGALLSLNPAYGIVLNFRRGVLGGPLDIGSLTISGIVSLGLLVGGCYYFRKVERDFADLI